MGSTKITQSPRRSSLSNSKPLQNNPSSDDLSAIFNKAVQQQHEMRSPGGGKKERLRMKIEVQ
jgi:hypothetical protein